MRAYGCLFSFLGRRRSWDASASGCGISAERHRGLPKHDAGLGCLMGRLRAYSISGADAKAPSPGGHAAAPLSHVALRVGGGPHYSGRMRQGSSPGSRGAGASPQSFTRPPRTNPSSKSPTTQSGNPPRVTTSRKRVAAMAVAPAVAAPIRAGSQGLPFPRRAASAPTSPPNNTRPARGSGSVRAGIPGTLSANISPAASTSTRAATPGSASHRSTLQSPRAGPVSPRAAATAARPEKLRNPVIAPRPTAATTPATCHRRSGTTSCDCLAGESSTPTTGRCASGPDHSRHLADILVCRDECAYLPMSGWRPHRMCRDSAGAGVDAGIRIRVGSSRRAPR